MNAAAETGDALMEASGELCVVILAPFGQDAALIAQMLTNADIEVQVVSTLEAFAQKLPDGAAGVLTTEALSPEAIAHLQTILQTQPPWSDIPIILIPTVSGEEWLDQIAPDSDLRPDSALLSAVEDAAPAMPVVFGGVVTGYNRFPSDLAGTEATRPADFFLSSPSVMQNVGFVEVPQEVDGVTHRAYLYLPEDGPSNPKVRPSFAGLLAARYLGIDPDNAPALLRLGHLGRDRRSFYINYTGAAFPTIPASHLTDASRLNEDEKRLLRGAVLLIGTTYRTTSDMRKVPMEARPGDLDIVPSEKPHSLFAVASPGVSVQAQILSTILDNRPLLRWPSELEALFALLVGGGAIGLCIGLPPARLYWLSGLLTLLYLWACFTLFFDDRLLPLTAPLLALWAPIAAFQTRRGIQERQERDQVELTMLRYVSPFVAHYALYEADGWEMQREERTLTIMFLDIRNSTALAQNLPPAAFLDALNEVFRPIVEAVDTNSGVILGYRGDGFLAAFGLRPSRSGNAAFDGLNAALAAIRSTPRRSREQGALQVACSLHTGPVACGKLGTPNRCEYTLVGDAANVAAKLEGLNKPQDGPGGKKESVIILSRETWDSIPEKPAGLGSPEQGSRSHLGGRSGVTEFVYFLPEQV